MHKAVILARGLGTRMRRADDGASLDQRQQAVAETGVKALIPIGPEKGTGPICRNGPEGASHKLDLSPFPAEIGRPFLDYVLSALADAGYRQVCLVVAPDHAAIRQYYDQVRPKRVRIEYAVQEEPRGTADAVAAAEPFAGPDPFLVVNSDTYYPLEALRRLRQQEGFAAALFEQEAMFDGSNISAERIRQFAVGQIDARGRLVRILEKPTTATLASLPRPLWLSMNCWRFGPPVFEACRRIRPSPRGELEVTDAVQYVIDVLGEPFHAVTVRAPVLDLTSRQDVATIASRLAGVEVSL